MARAPRIPRFINFTAKRGKKTYTIYYTDYDYPEVSDLYVVTADDKDVPEKKNQKLYEWAYGLATQDMTDRKMDAAEMKEDR